MVGLGPVVTLVSVEQTKFRMVAGLIWPWPTVSANDASNWDWLSTWQLTWARAPSGLPRSSRNRPAAAVLMAMPVRMPWNGVMLWHYSQYTSVDPQSTFGAWIDRWEVLDNDVASCRTARGGSGVNGDVASSCAST